MTIKKLIISVYTTFQNSTDLILRISQNVPALHVGDLFHALIF